MSERDGLTPTNPILSYQTPGGPDALTWATVWTGNNTMEANLMVNKLQSLGIHARVDMENSAYLGGLAGNIYGTKVQVLSADADAVRTILAEIDQRRVKRIQSRTLRCPQCGTLDPKRKMHAIRWVGLGCIAAVFVLAPMFSWAFVLLPIGFLMLVWVMTPLWQCQHCDHRWSAQELEELEEDDEAENENDDDR